MNRERVRCLYCRRLFRPDPRCCSPRACPDPACQRRRRNASHKRWRDADPEVLADRRQASREWRRTHSGWMQEYRREHPEYVERNRQMQRKRRLEARLAKRVVKSSVISPQVVEKYNQFTQSLRVVKSISIASRHSCRLQGAP
jgi:hypothetical protein